jgi:hypothetical protein
MESDGFSITNFDLFSEPPPFAATITSTLSPGTTVMWTTAGVLSLVFFRCARRVRQHRGAQLVVRVVVGAAHALVDHVLDAHRGVPAHVHADPSGTR